MPLPIPLICFNFHQLLKDSNKDNISYIITVLYWCMGLSGEVALILVFGIRVNEKVRVRSVIFDKLVFNLPVPGSFSHSTFRKLFNVTDVLNSSCFRWAFLCRLQARLEFVLAAIGSAVFIGIVVVCCCCFPLCNRCCRPLPFVEFLTQPPFICISSIVIMTHLLSCQLHLTVKIPHCKSHCYIGDGNNLTNKK